MFLLDLTGSCQITHQAILAEYVKIMGLISTQGVRMQPELVGRDGPINHFDDILDRINRNGPVNSNIIEYYGSPGIGKSALLGELARRAESKGARVAMINFEDENTSELERDPSVVIEKLASQLGINQGDFARALAEYRISTLPRDGVVKAYGEMDQETRLYQRPDWLNKFREMDVEFIKAVNVRKSPSVLLFDEAGATSTEMLDFVEEWIINPIVQVKTAIIGFATTRPWRWKRPEIRRRLTSTQIGPLRQEQVEELLGRSWPSWKGTLTSAIIGEIYQTTGGHPGAIWAVINS